MSQYGASKSNRPQRVADQIQKEMAQLLQYGAKDPRLGFITITAVKVARDFSWADVYYTVMQQDGGSDFSQTQEALEHGASYYRSEIARAIKLRVTPKLRFHYDNSVIHGAKMESLISSAVESDRVNAAASSDAEQGDGSVQDGDSE